MQSAYKLHLQGEWGTPYIKKNWYYVCRNLNKTYFWYVTFKECAVNL